MDHVETAISRDPPHNQHPNADIKKKKKKKKTKTEEWAYYSLFY
jgi:hypothetical protein